METEGRLNGSKGGAPSAGGPGGGSPTGVALGLSALPLGSMYRVDRKSAAHQNALAMHNKYLPNRSFDGIGPT